MTPAICRQCGCTPNRRPADLRFERVAVPPVRIHRNIQEQLPGEQQLIRDNIKANEEAYKNER